MTKRRPKPDLVVGLRQLKTAARLSAADIALFCTVNGEAVPERLVVSCLRGTVVPTVAQLRAMLRVLTEHARRSASPVPDHLLDTGPDGPWWNWRDHAQPTPIGRKSTGNGDRHAPSSRFWEYTGRTANIIQIITWAPVVALIAWLTVLFTGEDDPATPPATPSTTTTPPSSVTQPPTTTPTR